MTFSLILSGLIPSGVSVNLRYDTSLLPTNTFLQVDF
jgi:hypothetical protein